METKQTAVQWLQDKLFELEIKIDSKTHEEAFFIFERAKVMEKEQMLNLYNEGRDFCQYTYDEEYGGIEYWDREPLEFEDYYNETYGKQ